MPGCSDVDRNDGGGGEIDGFNSTQLLAKIDSQYEEMCSKLSDLALLQDLRVDISKLSDVMRAMRNEMQVKPQLQSGSMENSFAVGHFCDFSVGQQMEDFQSETRWQMPEETGLLTPKRSVKPLLGGALLEPRVSPRNSISSGGDKAQSSEQAQRSLEKLERLSSGLLETEERCSSGGDAMDSLERSNSRARSPGSQFAVGGQWAIENVRTARRCDSPVRMRDTVDTIQSPSARTQSFTSGERSRFSKVARKVQLHPDSIWRSVWDIFSCVALIFDSIMIPYMIAWSPPVEGFIKFGMVFTASFWITDVCVALNTSYFTVDGELEQRPVRIFCRYLKSTLILDVVICATDWAGLMMELSNEGSDSPGSSNEGWALVRIIKINRVFRIASVLRVSRLMDRIDKFNQMFLSNTWQVLTQVGAICVFVLWLNHILCCAWYTLGKLPDTDTGQSWLDGKVNSKSSSVLSGASALYQYTTAYHWSMTQMTPGSMQVVPMNSTERVANIIILLFSLIFLTFVTSRLSALMVQLQIARQAQAKEVLRLRTFLRQQGVSASLAQRVEMSIMMKFKAKKPLSENEIPALASLPRSLRSELKLDIFSPQLLRQPIFTCMARLSGRIIQTVCDIVESRQLATNEELFATGISTKRSYIFLHGCLSYTMPHLGEVEESMLSHHNLKVNQAQTWILSAAFWMDGWTTRGCMEAETLTEVMVLDADRILPQILCQQSKLGIFLRLYRESYLAVARDSTESLSDVHPAVDHALVVSRLPVATRKELCHHVLEQIKHKTWLRWGTGQALKDLENEINDGKCTLITNSDGLPIRVAIVVALRICRPSGAILVQVGNIKDSQYTPVCRLPGTKLQQRELLSEAAVRLRKEVMEDLQTSTEIVLAESCETLVEETASPTYGLITQYRRNIFDALMNVDDIEASGEREPPRIEAQPSSNEEKEKWSEKFSVAHFLTPSTFLAQRSDGLSAVSRRSRRSSRHSLNASIESEDVFTVIRATSPWLERHCPHHLLVAMSTETKGCVYAWIHPDDFATLKACVEEK